MDSMLAVLGSASKDSQTEKLSTLLVTSSKPLRTLRGKGSTSRKVNTMGGGSRKLTRNFHPAGMKGCSRFSMLQTSVQCAVQHASTPCVPVNAEVMVIHRNRSLVVGVLATFRTSTATRCQHLSSVISECVRVDNGKLLLL